MQLDLDVTGRQVLVLGTVRGTRLAVARHLAGGACVTLLRTDDGPTTTGPVRVLAAPGPDDSAGLLRLLGPAWLLVSVDAPVELRDRLEELAGHLRVLTTREAAAATRGGVTLVGGAPAARGC